MFSILWDLLSDLCLNRLVVGGCEWCQCSVYFQFDFDVVIVDTIPALFGVPLCACLAIYWWVETCGTWVITLDTFAWIGAAWKDITWFTLLAEQLSTTSNTTCNVTSSTCISRCQIVPLIAWCTNFNVKVVTCSTVGATITLVAYTSDQVITDWAWCTCLVSVAR